MLLPKPEQEPCLIARQIAPPIPLPLPSAPPRRSRDGPRAGALPRAGPRRPRVPGRVHPAGGRVPQHAAPHQHARPAAGRCVSATRLLACAARSSGVFALLCACALPVW